MLNETEICNRALAKIGERPIADLSDDTTAARACRAIYAVARDAELSAHAWMFATARASLPASATAPEWGWQRSFPLPSDCLRLLTVRGGDRPGLYELENRAVVTNLPAPLRVRYVRRVTDSLSFDPMFVEALACRIALELAERITQSTSKRQLAQGEYRAAITAARQANSLPQPAEVMPDTSWLDEAL